MTPWTVAHQAPLSMGFSRQEYWRGLPFSPPGDLPSQGSSSGFLHWRADSFLLSHQGMRGCPLLIPNPAREAAILTFSTSIYHSDKQGQAQISSAEPLSRVQLIATPWTAALRYSLSVTNSWSVPKLMSIKSVMPSTHRILCHILLFAPPILPSIKVFSNESVLHIKWPKYWNFSFSISPSNEFSGLIFFRTDCLDLLAVQGTLKSLLQHHSSKASILQRSASFIVPTLIHT